MRGPHPDPVPKEEGTERPLPLGEGADEGRSAARRFTSEQLFTGGAVEVQIDHHGVLYRLKQTALGKLILTK